MATDKRTEHFLTALKAGVRADGRGLTEYRPFTVERSVSSTAHGSTRVTSGDQIVIAGVKFELGTPYPDTPQDGSLMVSAELLPLANREFEPGPPSIDSIELARVTDRTIRESKAMDLSTLCIEEGKAAWTVAVDIAPINANGSLFDISALASLIAIRDARKPTITNGVPDYENLSENRLELARLPITVTVYRCGEYFLIDPTQDEMRYCDARLSIATLDEKTICALQKGLDGALSVDEVEQMVTIALEKGTELRALVTEA
jgi:exosome complex component RRP42